jgi:Tfp pilus assembly protein PilF
VAYSAPSPPAPQLAPAAGTLAAQAEQQRKSGDHVGAAATLERALRISPQEAYLWNRLARVRMEQGRYAQAGNFAQRSNALAKDQPQLKQDNWGMIAVSRRTSGDVAGATEAEEKARGG